PSTLPPPHVPPRFSRIDRETSTTSSPSATRISVPPPGSGSRLHDDDGRPPFSAHGLHRLPFRRRRLELVPPPSRRPLPICSTQAAATPLRQPRGALGSQPPAPVALQPPPRRRHGGRLHGSPTVVGGGDGGQGRWLGEVWPSPKASCLDISGNCPCRLVYFLPSTRLIAKDW
ncbi:Os09g0129400, partial [Oryza sativa Japonica Group]